MAGVSPRALAELPQALTEADWVNKGGRPEAPLTSELAQGERLHARLDVAALLPSGHRPRSLTALEQAVTACEDHRRSRLAPLEDQLRAIERAARRQAEDLSRQRAAPQAEAARQIAQAARGFAVLCSTVDWQDDYAATRRAIMEGADKTGLMVDDAAARLLRAACRYDASPQRAADWQALIRPEGHRLSQIVSALPDYRARFWHKFKMFQSFDIAALKLEGGEEIDRTKRLAVLHQALRQTEAIADHDPD